MTRDGEEKDEKDSLDILCLRRDEARATIERKGVTLEQVMSVAIPLLGPRGPLSYLLHPCQQILPDGISAMADRIILLVGERERWKEDLAKKIDLARDQGRAEVVRWCEENTPVTELDLQYLKAAFPAQETVK